MDTVPVQLLDHALIPKQSVVVMIQPGNLCHCKTQLSPASLVQGRVLHVALYVASVGLLCDQLWLCMRHHV